MKFTLLASTALLAVVSGQIVSITSPLSGTKLKAGTNAMLSWVSPKVPTISQIVLAKGPSNALQPVTTIASNVDTASGKYEWKIPYEIENGEYSFELGTSPDLAFAGPVTIEGGVGGTLPAANGTASSPSSSPSTGVTSPGAAAAAPPAGNSAPSSHAAPSAASASNAKAPAGASPTASSANQLSSTGGKYLVAAAGVVVVASQFF
ncbi:hypothetical protein BCR42DRAFT_453412 [Absidia repens]|uniref:Yeast cell wall synthesis Kre9/Knh1-like N-terminal domain-containing protein n=1 Tax=Absidia repens TaxID=90262 RepID=A0A1X2IAA1_9FUNG|nr:hypothetical protein BCR42DRAFT_453412 [Absidia repens]